MTGLESKLAPSQRLALLVRLGKDSYALPIAAIEEVYPALPVESIPQCPDFVRGVVFVRGRLLPVVDAAQRLRLENHPSAPDPHIVCLRLGDRRVGLEVDEALRVVDLEPATSLAADEFGGTAALISGVVDLEGQVIRWLNPETLTTPGENAAAWEQTLHAGTPA